MFKIFITNYTYNKINYFINSYSENFINMYSNTGIYNEKLILNSYIVLGENFRELIISSIKKIFTEEKIFGISKTESGKQYTTISVNNFRLFVYYIEEKEEGLRIIDDIEIFKK